jgi:hypothetical protein
MARFEIDFLLDYSDESLLEELRRVAAMMPAGQPLTKAAFERLQPKVSESTLCHRFGGWKEALERAGLFNLYSGQVVSEKMRSHPGKQLSKDALIVELRRVHAEVGTDWLTADDFNANSKTSEAAIRSRFGGFRAGLETAGIPFHPNNWPRFTEEQCFENLGEVWTQLGRAPEYREMFRAPSKIRGKTYLSRWGTWRKALRAFVDWTNADSLPLTPEESKSRIIDPEKAEGCNRNQADCRDVRPGLRFKVFMRDKFRCVVCGRSPATHLNVVLHADHWDPVANQGKTTLDNLKTLCQDCNLGKGKIVPKIV